MSQWPLSDLPETIKAQLTLSTILSEDVEPVEPKEASPVTPDKPIPATPKKTVVPVSLAFSSISSVDTEPIEARSPRRDAGMIPRDVSDHEKEIAKKDEPETPKGTFLGSVFGWKKGQQPTTPIIAEDETRQSPSDSPMNETPESQRPFKELSSNSQESQRPFRMLSSETSQLAAKKLPVETNDESSQTALTANEIDEMLKRRKQASIIAEDSQKISSPTRSVGGVIIPGGEYPRRSQESIGSVGRARSKMIEPESPLDTCSATLNRLVAQAAERTHCQKRTHHCRRTTNRSSRQPLNALGHRPEA